jgi:iron(III) transport system ATP-binding protein
VALRPEAIALVPERRPDALEGEVKKATYLGSHMEYTVATALGELFVIDPGRTDRSPPAARFPPCWERVRSRSCD